MKVIGFALMAGVLGLAAPAHAQMVRAQDPASVVAAMQAGGYPATLGTDAVGDPLIKSAIGDTNFEVYFYNCVNNRACATVQFHAGYDFDDDTPSLTTINAFNRAQRFADAYLDGENDPIVEMDVDLDDGGMSQALFIDNLQFWESVVDKFETAIDY